MAREPERKGGIFGGRRSLKEDLQDISGNERVGFEDTWLGDVLGFDGSIGTSGPGLRESWRGARRRRSAEPVDPEAARRRAAAARAGERAAQDELRTTLAERPSYYRLADGDGLRDPGPLGTVTYGPQNGRGGRRGTVQPDVAPQVGDTAPTMSSPSVPSDNGSLGSGTDRVPLVSRPTPLPGVVDENAPTIEAATTYPIRAKLETLLGPRSPYVTQVLPRVIQTKLTGGGQNDINGLVRQVEALPDSQTRAEVLAELYKMRDSMRGGGGGY